MEARSFHLRDVAIKRALLFLAVAVLWSGTSLFASPQAPVGGPDLTIDKSHGAPFGQGPIGTYTITVINSGDSPTSGTVTVTDTLPSGLSLSQASGNGWSCSTGGQSVSCTRSDPLGAVASYPIITLRVKVASNALNQ